MGEVLQLFPDYDKSAQLSALENRQNLCEIIVGDASRVLLGFPEGLFQTVVTSPPYWGLRDYGIKGQTGAETDVNEYISNLVLIFRQVRRPSSSK